MGQSGRTERKGLTKGFATEEGWDMVDDGRGSGRNDGAAAGYGRCMLTPMFRASVDRLESSSCDTLGNTS